ncbi:MAG: DUF3090 family protein [Chloroflexota bacterium]|jgi:uncharacterized repeat protein (TIGR03847 family)
MTEYAYDLNPVQRIVADAVGDPGQRTFFLQGTDGLEVVSVVLEKQEVANLAISVLQLLEELEEKFPDLAQPQSTEENLVPEVPFEAAFRVGQLVVGYDEDDDMVWIIAKALIVSESGAVVDPDEEDVPTVRFVATREQMRLLSDHALEVVSKGRPTCPLCGNPINPEGHFCPRSDGQAMPIVF